MSSVIAIQNVDFDVRTKDYEKFGDDIVVTSIFKTLQGEGPYAGYPAVFLRLSGCNFGSKSHFCKFCDTSFQLDKGTPYTAEELYEELKKESGEGNRLKHILVITGGEPLLQRNLLKLIELEQKNNWFSTIQVETNGTQVGFFKEYQDLIDNNEDMMAEYHFNPLSFVISPKASYKAGRYGKISDQVLKHTDCLKFVLDADPNSPHHSVPEWAFEKQKEFRFNIYVSPMAIYNKAYTGEVSSIWDEELINKEATSRNYQYAAQYAIDNNIRLSTQQHLFVNIA